MRFYRNIMQIKRVIIWVFVLFLALTILTLTTPLAFKNHLLRNIIYFLTVLLSFIVAKEFKNKYLRNVIRLLPLATILFIIISSLIFDPFANNITNDWKTVSISYRKINHSDTYIGQQMLDIGGLGYRRRIVKVIPITPFLNWITPIDTNKLSGNWVRVNEDYSPFNWKY